MWDFNGEDDATRHSRKGPDSAAALIKILSALYKGEEEEFLRVNPQGGFTMYNPPNWVSGHFYLSTCFVFPLYSLTTLTQELRQAVKEINSPLHNPRIQDGPSIRPSKRIRTYLWS